MTYLNYIKALCNMINSNGVRNDTGWACKTCYDALSDDNCLAKYLILPPKDQPCQICNEVPSRENIKYVYLKFFKNLYWKGKNCSFCNTVLKKEPLGYCGRCKRLRCHDCRYSEGGCGWCA